MFWLNINQIKPCTFFIFNLYALFNKKLIKLVKDVFNQENEGTNKNKNPI